MIRVVLPAALRTLARVEGEVQLEVVGSATIGSVLDALEAKYPALLGTLRDHTTRQRRAFVRFFACEEDWSHEPHDKLLPDAIGRGREPLLVIGAIAGGSRWESASAVARKRRGRLPIGRGFPIHPTSGITD